MSNKQLSHLLSLSLKHLRSQDQIFELFDEIFTDRLEGIKPNDLANIMDVVAEHNQIC
jgi:hypothetical protein